MNNLKIAYNVNDMINQYNDWNSGHFFDKDTMRFFRSKVTDNYKRLDDQNALFITTEQFSSETSKRLATIRHAKVIEYVREDGRKCVKISIDTVKEFNKMTLYRAKKDMNKLTLKGLT